MTKRFGRNTWSIVVPDGWHASHGDECSTLENSTGALQLSAYFKSSEVSEADLREFASEHLEAGAIPSAARCGDFIGFEFAYADDECFCRQWHLRHGTQLLFVTYTCALGHERDHDAALDRALGSLVATDP